MKPKKENSEQNKEDRCNCGESWEENGYTHYRWDHDGTCFNCGDSIKE